MPDITAILLAILALPSGTGIWVGIRAGIRWMKKGRNGRQEEADQKRVHAEVAAANQSVLVVATSQAQLVADNDRLRGLLREADERHAKERTEWMSEKIQMRREIDDMERRLREAMGQLNEALAEIRDWRRRTALEAPPDF